MFSKNALLTLIIIILALPTLEAQFTIDAEIRPRGEFRNGFKTPRPEEADPAFFIEQRSRLYFGFKADRIKLQLNVQDVRIWGNADQIYKQDPALTNIQQGWGEFFVSPRFSVKLGRQEISYDTERFLGGLGWAAQGRSHDALLLKYENDTSGWKVHLGGAFNQNVPFEPAQLESTFYTGVNNYKSMLYLWANKTGDFGEISLLIHNDGRQVLADSSMAHRQTFGLVGSFPIGDGGFSLDGEVYYQGGRNQADKKVSAVLAALHANVKVGEHSFLLGGEYMSGTAPDETETDNAWNPLYGTNHKWYGFMDYFYVGNGHGQNGNTSGLIDLQLKGNFKAGKGRFAVAAHNFMSPVDVLDPASPSNTLSRQLGVEIDLTYTINIVPSVNVQCGYSHMFATESMEAIKGGGYANKLNNWAFIMVGFKPQVLNTAKD